MNREIEFRGLTHEGKWVYGDLFTTHISHAWQATCIMTDEFDKDRFASRKIYEVQPETVGEYTGLADKNGTEIYEGDIVKYKLNSGSMEDDEYSEHEGIVKFVKGHFTSIPIIYECEDSWYSYRSYDHEIIGNIYEQPQEGEKQ